LIGFALVAALTAGAALATAPVQVKRLPGVVLPTALADPDLRTLQEGAEAGRIDPGKLPMVELATLDLRKGFVPGVASVEFRIPSNVSPEDNEVTFDRLAGDFSSHAKVLFQAPAAGTYFFDFAVKGHAGPDGAQRTLVLENIGFPAQTRTLKVGDQHAMYVFKAAAPGPMLMVLESKNTSWTFRSLTISQLK